MNLILCGMMGAGKTSVGGAIARLTGRRFVDTDALIVGKYGNIVDIFAQSGECYFRELETETVRALAKEEDLVIATGGGVVLKAENLSLLRRNGKIVYLRARLDTLVSRLQTDAERPLLQGEDLQQRLEILINERATAYERAADFTVDVDGKTPSEIAAEIIEKTANE